MPKYKRFFPGQRVTDRFGTRYTVAWQNGCRVFLEGYCGWIHPANLIAGAAADMTAARRAAR
jgi:hypothetical protein